MLEVGIFPKFEVSEMLPKTHQMSGKKILSQRFFYSFKLLSPQNVPLSIFIRKISYAAPTRGTHVRTHD